jgi:hypothetical protein
MFSPSPNEASGGADSRFPAQVALGLQPIIDVVSILAPARTVQLVCVPRELIFWDGCLRCGGDSSVDERHGHYVVRSTA